MINLSLVGNRFKTNHCCWTFQISSVEAFHPERMGLLCICLLICEIILLSDCARGPPRVAEKIAHRQTARIGRTMKLQCPVEGDPPPLIMWTKDGRNIHSGWMRFRVLQQALRIKDVEAEDSGTFICKATNGFGSVNINYTLIVIDDASTGRDGAGTAGDAEYSTDQSGKFERTNSKPILTGTHPVNTTVDYGGTTSFQCKVRSDVKPVIQWLKRVEPGNENKYNSTIEVGDHRFVVLPTGDVWSRPDGSYLNKLLITRAKDEDAGMYICLGANTMGYSFRSAFLTVLPDPKPHHIPVPTAISPSLPWPVIIGIPAGVVFILGTVLLWFCQSKHHCSSGRVVTTHASQRPPPRVSACPPSSGDKDCLGSLTYEEYITQQQQLLLAQGGNGLEVPKVYPKIYTDIHTHTHSHVDGKVHQHQHIHYQC
ncbi:fibroblast growth factor receptor-like 1 isoform X3 [Oncorhynchus mykiss]|uniref:fibroblast growth factor receptor-like 1 isoform X3 n=1 Tax=Oncorhynchus mykiss TaxID=8022 RepID=UPI001878E2E8|nr:fibroblast growth factor receptor-like 1 isoform X3 [Oncorhynchus mykiss]